MHIVKPKIIITLGEDTYNYLTGENVNIKSGKDTVIIGSNIQGKADGKVEIGSKGNIIQAGVKDVNYSYKKTSKSGFLGLTGRSKSSETQKEQAVKSNTLSGMKGIDYNVDKNIILTGVNIVSTGNISLKGKNVEVNPLEENNYSETIKKKKGFSVPLVMEV